MSDPTEDTAAAAMPAPTFKRKKRPAQARSVDPKPLADSALQDADDDHRDSTSETLDELLALRRLKRSTAGLELDRLNSGERRKRAKAAPSAAAGEQGAEGYVLREDGTVEGTQGGLRGGSGGAAAAGQDRLRDDAESHDARQRKIIKTDNFTGQTNTVDVDKHMLAYIDAELAKRRDPSSASGSSGAAAAASNKPLDPRDELYAVADKYKFADIAALEEGKKARDEDEGNVTLSASMLMGIPEVDLGIDTKLANIEATEKAKRQLSDAKAAARAARLAHDEADEMAADRFYRHRRPLESDTDALERARAAAAAAADPALADPDYALRKARPGAGGGGRRELATDDMAMARFKKRQQGTFGGGGGGGGGKR
ncbi:hepatocellular carcinoma-associated antigen 59-domain-containing protein [Rhodotorula diobovata]|uniref:Hepatocellular carcinoma-associated antigen 59-domain-containing protein n=1 Tax=Rhodotorula diobovata TaxID=5288 RepID=A0A5C5FWH4_9BASI|nr:hepatocellular carcinoma-associated antigen 59-domain-containing protein [Rhodotorula diobovata]